MNINFFYRCLVTFLMTFFSISLYAYDFEVDGIYYNKLSETDNEVEVTSAPNKYVGDIIIPETIMVAETTYLVTRIGRQSFDSCNNLKSIRIPKSITSISVPSDNSYPSPSAATAIFDCEELESIIVDDENPIYDSRENCNAIIEKSSNTLLYGCNCTSIPNSVSNIGYYAFGGSGLKAVDIPVGVVKIDKSAFSNCWYLTSVKLPNGLKQIGDYAFAHCLKLTSILLPSSLEHIGEWAFSYTPLDVVKSVIITPFSISPYVFANISSDAVLQVPKGTKELYSNTLGWKDQFARIEEVDLYCNYTITSFGTNGSVICNGKTIRTGSSSFTTDEGTEIILKFVPDDGYMVSKVIVNGKYVTSQIVDNQLVITDLSPQMQIEVYFGIKSYFFDIASKGNGNVKYSTYEYRDKSVRHSVNHGQSVTVYFIPDAGYRIKSVILNGTDITSSILASSNNKYTISYVTSNNTIEIEFERITYLLSIKSVGKGIVSYNGDIIRETSNTYIVEEGSSVSILLNPDDGYHVKTIKLNGTNVTSLVSYTQYTISNVNRNSTLVVEFEINTYTLTITATGNGLVSYNDATTKNASDSFVITHDSSVKVSFIPDDCYLVKSVLLNGADVTSSIINNQLTITNISSNYSIEVEFAEDVMDFAIDDVNYRVISYEDRTALLASGYYYKVISVPATFNANNRQWNVIGVETDALTNCADLAAIIWNPEMTFNGNVNNPNLLLYVKDKKYAGNVKNVIVNGEADEIVLQDAEGGNNFYCPQTFTAKSITYEHSYGMKSGLNVCQGWETIALPFDVTSITNKEGKELIPHAAWSVGNNQYPFWLYSLSIDGWKAESSIKANTPYLISMPNNEYYDEVYNITGKVIFKGSNMPVKASDNLNVGMNGNKKLIPNYQNQTEDAGIWALNVNNQWSQNTASEVEGSVFVQSLRPVRPFEAYLTVSGSEAARRVIPIFEEGESTGIIDLPLRDDINVDTWFTLDGRKLFTKPTEKGVYIHGSKKVMVK